MAQPYGDPGVNEPHAEQDDDQIDPQVKYEAEIQTINKMNIEQKSKLVKDFNLFHYLYKGAYIDAMDTTNKYLVAQITEKDENFLSVNFDGWSHKFDQKFRVNSYKIAPFRTQRWGYSGQVKVALRPDMPSFRIEDLRNYRAQVENFIAKDLEWKNAHDTTQYLRGHLVVYLDHLMGYQFEDLQVLNEVEDFIRAVLRLIVKYMKKLQTLTQTFKESNQIVNLFLVDQRAAILACFPEFSETLKRVFGLCWRALRYYAFFDGQQQSPAKIIADQRAKQGTFEESIMQNTYGVVVEDFTQSNFEEAKIEDESNFFAEEMRMRVIQSNNIIFGKLLNFTQYFAEIGGFDALIAALKIGSDNQLSSSSDNSKQGDMSDVSMKSSKESNQESVKIPFEIMQYLLQPFRNLKQCLKPEFARTICDQVQQIVNNRLHNMSEKELKEVDKDSVSGLMKELRLFLQIGLNGAEIAQVCETTSLFLALRYLKSKNLEKRLKGLNDIRYMLDRVVQGVRDLKRRTRQQWTDNDNFYQSSPEEEEVFSGNLRVAASEFITCEQMIDWLQQNKVLEIILSENAHIEIVKRSSSILKFLSRYGNSENCFTETTVDLVWKCQLGKHEEMVRTVYNLIEEIAPVLSIERLDNFFARIKQMPPQQYDEKFLQFLTAFTKTALEKRYKQLQTAAAVTSSQEQRSDEALDAQLSKKELTIIENISSIIGLGKEDAGYNWEIENNHYGVSIFWLILQDEGLQGKSFTVELQELALETLNTIFKQNYRKLVRTSYLVKSLRNIIEHKSVIQSIKIATQTIASLNVDYLQLKSNVDLGDNESQIIPPQREPAQQDQPALNVIISNLDSQLKIIDVLIENIAKFASTQKKRDQSCQQQSNIQSQGKYTHTETLQAILDLIEFLICQSAITLTDDYGNQSVKLTINLGKENIQKLWDIFVTNSQQLSDQTLFLNWINKQRYTVNMTSNRVYKDYFMNQYDRSNAHQEQIEISIFAPDEKQFLFTEILCNPDRIMTSKMTLAQIKCFQNNFKEINKEKGYLAVFGKRLEVIMFDQLLGKEALWNIALTAEDEKTREISQDLLVDIHLNFDNAEDESVIAFKSVVLTAFIDRCMQQLTQLNNDNTENPKQASILKKCVLRLLSLMLDRYEGKRPIKPEMQTNNRQLGYKPFNLPVINYMDPSNKTAFKIPISIYQTVNFLRLKIAQSQNLQLNQFHLVCRNVIIEPENDGDKYIKDIPALLQGALIKQNPHYKPELHPKFLLQNNPEYFQTLFQMLKESQASEVVLLQPVWELVNRLPVSVTIMRDIESLETVSSATTPDQRSIAWSDLLDAQSTFKLLYCLQIIKGRFLEGDTESQVAWREQFWQLGGFEHLLRVFTELNVSKIDSSLTLSCIQILCKTIIKFNVGREALPQLNSDGKQVLILSSVKYIDLVVQYSLSQEEERGDSFEDIEKRIQLAKFKKNKYKMLMSGNKAEAKVEKDEDVDETNEDRQKQLEILEDFRAQQLIVSDLFDFITSLVGPNIQEVNVFTIYPNLEQLLTCGTLYTENSLLRSTFCNRLVDMMKAASASGQFLLHPILQILLFKILSQTSNEKLEPRCYQFYLNVSVMLEGLQQTDLLLIKGEIQSLMFYLVECITNKPSREISAQDNDWLLQGYLVVMTRLLQKFPELKKEIGNILIKQILHDCLFEIPHGGHSSSSEHKSAPKCKSSNTRKHAFELLAVLCRDCIENIEVVLEFMKQFNNAPTWRTKRETDWNIMYLSEEKSSTGRVGIKNLGCICYMNSLNQQLFMIPGFRNDVLSIKDPNHDNQPDEDNMFLQWQILLSGLLLSEKMYVNPKSFCHAFKDWEGEPINVIEQMDVEEYLAMFLDRLENAIKGTPQAKTIQYHFGGTFANEIICKTCPHTYDRAEQFLNLSIPVKNKKSIYEGLDAFIQGDLLEDQNQYLCGKCDKKVDALKRTSIKRLPRYLIATLKRFEFDFDRMIRVKVNDYFEFPENLDLRKYTQEYLNQKEQFEKEREEKAGKEEQQEEQGEFQPKLSYPDGYYEYELVGVVIHTGTADSGHYYTYIKEQEHQTDQEKWYEFNDILVRDFDKSEIPQECFGGEETSYSSTLLWGQQSQKYMKFRNAYIVVYRRKEQDPNDQFLDEEEKAPESERATQQLGLKKLIPSSDNPIVQRVVAENHKYWQNRFLFGAEYHEFVVNMLTSWNTKWRVPEISTNRNPDLDLLDPILQQACKNNLETCTLPPLGDVPLDLTQIYSQERLSKAMLEVFKYAASFYVTTLQRAADKTQLPNMVLYLKSYLNMSSECSRWFLSEFVNLDLIRENILENSVKFMRCLISGLLWCAMLKVYEEEKDQLNDFWTDLSEQQIKKESEPAKPLRQTVLGSFILCLLYLLPDLRKYSSHQSQYLQLIARFSTMGPEARRFLLHAGSLGKMLNLFYGTQSPYHKDFIAAPRLPFELNAQPEMGLPTPEDPNAKKTNFALLKEQQRMKSFQSDDPNYNNLLIVIGNLARTLRVSEDSSNQTPYAEEDSGFTLTEEENLLFLPQAEFIQKLIAQGTTVGASVALARGYAHFGYVDQSVAEKLFQTIQLGLREHDFGEIKPYLVLFQLLLQSTESTAIASKIDEWLLNFVTTIIPENQHFYQWMEVVIDFLLKVALRLPHVRQWFYNNQQTWAYLLEWVNTYRQPPSQYNMYNQPQSKMRLNKPRNTTVICMREDKQRNEAFALYRIMCLKNLKLQGEQAINLSHEIDFDFLDMTDYKPASNELMDYVSERSIGYVQRVKILSYLGELAQIQQLEGTEQGGYNIRWILTDKDLLLPADALANTNMIKETRRFEEIMLKRRQQEEQINMQRRGNQQIGYGEPEMEVDEDEDQDAGKAGGDQRHYSSYAQQNDSGEEELSGIEDSHGESTNPRAAQNNYSYAGQNDDGHYSNNSANADAGDYENDQDMD